MDKLSEKLFAKLKGLNLGVGELARNQSLLTFLHTELNPKEQEDIKGTLEALEADDFISVSDTGIQLKQKGYDHIFSEYSIQDTEEKILNALRKFDLRRGDAVPFVPLFHQRNEWGRYYFDTFQAAFDSLIANGYITKEGQSLFLSDKGFDKLYE